MRTCVALVLLLAICVSSSSALRCYSCVFPGNANCEHGKDLDPEECTVTTFETSTGIKPVCFKSVTNIAGGVKQITRSCSRQGGNINPCTILKDSEHCSVCESELCNGSTNVLISAWTLMMPLVAALFMKFF